MPRFKSSEPQNMNNFKRESNCWENTVGILIYLSPFPSLIIIVLRSYILVHCSRHTKLRSKNSDLWKILMHLSSFIHYLLGPWMHLNFKPLIHLPPQLPNFSVFFATPAISVDPSVSLAYVPHCHRLCTAAPSLLEKSSVLYYPADFVAGEGVGKLNADPA